MSLCAMPAQKKTMETDAQPTEIKQQKYTPHTRTSCACSDSLSSRSTQSNGDEYQATITDTQCPQR
eukprot:m.377334 g.377334  ORF g.377334 m.377334 type:complete len:66 (-) comp86454_c0_seq1:51-248(-)